MSLYQNGKYYCTMCRAYHTEDELTIDPKGSLMCAKYGKQVKRKPRGQRMPLDKIKLVRTLATVH